MPSFRSIIFIILSLFLVGCAGPRPQGLPPQEVAPQEITAQTQSAAALPPATAPQDQPPPTPLPTKVVPTEATQKTEAAAEAGNAPAAPVDSAQPNHIDLTHLPLGDGKISGEPRVGYIWACRTDPNAGGAFQAGPWIRGDGTYDLTAKAVVDGSASWPHQFEMTIQGDQRIFTSNDLPNHPTGNYPIAQNDDAYQYDRNPNRIAAQNMRIDLPMNPTLAARPACVPGAIGILLTGSVLFNALDAPGRDAVAHETQDGCQGHPQESGAYHYHSLTTCLADTPGSDGHSALMGYILDGFGLYGRYGEGGQELTSADLDECHGHTHLIEWNGRMQEMYHYHATWDFPYTVGCMRGNFDMAEMMTISGGPGGGQAGAPPQGGQPDLTAAAAQLGMSEQRLREALGPPPPNLAAAAARLGVSEQALRQALGAP